MGACWKISLAILVALIAAGVGYYYNWEYKVNHGIPIPGKPVSFPMGNIDALFADTNFLVGLETLTKQFADQITGLASIWQLDTQTISVSHHKDIEAVLSVTTNRISPAHVQKLMEYIIGPTALISLNGGEWVEFRKIVEAAVDATNFDKVVPDLIRLADETADFLVGSGRQLDSAPYLRNMAFKIVGTNVYNRPLTNVNNGTQAAVTLMTSELVRRTNSINPVETMFWFPTQQNDALNYARKLFHDDIKAEIANREARFEGVDINHEDFLKHLIAGKKLNNDQLVDTVSSMVFGSTETYSAFFATAMYVLGSRPEMQKKIYEEAKATFAAEKFTYDSLAFTNRVVKEVLRLYPPAPMTQRTLTQPIKVGEGASAVTLPSGTSVWIAAWTSQRLKANFPKPMEFNPDRFLEPVPPYANIPFNAGPRNCVAAAFAEKVLTVTTARLFFKGEYTTVGPKDPTQISNGFTEWPQDGTSIISKARA